MKTPKLFFIAVSSAAIIMLYACGGDKPSTETTNPKTETKETVTEGNNMSGETIYKKTCIACHQANGQGLANTFPPIAKSDFLSNKEAVIEQIIKGKSGEMVVNGLKYNSVMPPQNLSDEEISAVLGYVYSSWGNTGLTVTKDEVAAIRAKI